MTLSLNIVMDILPTNHIGLSSSPSVITHGSKKLIMIDGVNISLIRRVAIAVKLNSVEVRG